MVAPQRIDGNEKDVPAKHLLGRGFAAGNCRSGPKKATENESESSHAR